jgi:riboflavin kinase / FMN adenylyltransferase
MARIKDAHPMHVFHQLKEVQPSLPRAVAIGNFDGCHLGHVALLKGMVDYANSNGLCATVLTFYPHPVEVINPTKKLERLTTGLEKLSLLEKIGVEAVLVAPFDMDLAALTPADFFRQFLVEGLNSKSVHVGFNFCFGRARAGNTEILRGLCDSRGIHLAVQAPFELFGTKVSSSRIRGLLRDGDVAESAKLLGRFYTVSGEVSAGEHRGTQLGFPTANLRVPSEKVLPKNGVYVTKAHWQKQSYKSVTNVGIRPTFHSSELIPTVEVHFLDFHVKLYEQLVEIEFLDRIRDEIRFESVEALKHQIAKDVAAAKAYEEDQ